MMSLPRELIRAAPWPDRLRFDCSPIQLGLQGSPWHVVVSSILLCRARRMPTVLEDLLYAYPTPELLASADTSALERIVQPTGLHRNRARHLQQLSHKWYLNTWNDLRDLQGVGQYVADAVGLFCYGCKAVECDDGVLLKHAEVYDGPRMLRPICGIWTVMADGLCQCFDNPVAAYRNYRYLRYAG